MSWTDERVDKLKTMWSEGMSASQIAKSLGGVTRNAVIGKVHRLGLSNRAAGSKTPAPADAKLEQPAATPVVEKPTPPPAEIPKPAAPQPPARRPTPPAQVPAEGSTPAATLAELEKKAKKLSLLQLTERTCKWPIGDPATDDFFFCGQLAANGKPYCEAHVAVAFQPMSSRRDRSRARN